MLLKKIIIGGSSTKTFFNSVEKKPVMNII